MAATKPLSQFYLITQFIAALDADTAAMNTAAQEAMFSKLTIDDVAELTSQRNKLQREISRLISWWKWEGYGELNQK